jgi:iron-sulfur cluster repair protein YtfE (RIC family)
MEQTMSETAGLAELSVNETIRRYPGTVAVFRLHGIDACCGGPLPVAEAAARHGIDLDALLTELRASAAAGAGR